MLLLLLLLLLLCCCACLPRYINIRPQQEETDRNSLGTCDTKPVGLSVVGYCLSIIMSRASGVYFVLCCDAVSMVQSIIHMADGFRRQRDATGTAYLNK